MNLQESIRRILREEKLYATPQQLVKNLPDELKNLLFKQWGAKQNPEWHPEGNTLKHILVVLKRAYHHYPDDPNMIMAALFHDLGKMDTYSINPKTNQPTAYGHEDKSTDYVEQFKDWVQSFEGTDVDDIKYLVKNHMKVKPTTWDRMKDKKKEPIKSHPAFDKLMGFTDKLDGGGVDLKESIRRILRKELLNETDPKKGTGKKPEGSGRRLYTDENPSDTVSVKFRTKEDIVDTLNKDSFKSKPHKRQSQIINLIHQRVRAAYQNAKDPETKKRLKRAYDYIENVKEKSKEKTIKLQEQEKNEGDSKQTISNVKRRLNHIDNAFDYFINKVYTLGKICNFRDANEFIYVVFQAVVERMYNYSYSDIDDNSGEWAEMYLVMEKYFKQKYGHMIKEYYEQNCIKKQEQNEGELTEKCWKGYTQKGMKTMFGKRYPNCVKKTK